MRGTAVKDVIKAPSDSLGVLFKSLGEKYAVDPALTAVPGEYDTWLADGGKECADQVAKGDPFATRNYVGQESAGALIAGFRRASDDLGCREASADGWTAEH